MYIPDHSFDLVKLHHCSKPYNDGNFFLPQDVTKVRNLLDLSRRLRMLDAEKFVGLYCGRAMASCLDSYSKISRCWL